MIVTESIKIHQSHTVKSSDRCLSDPGLSLTAKIISVSVKRFPSVVAVFICLLRECEFMLIENSI